MANSAAIDERAIHVLPDESPFTYARLMELGLRGLHCGCAQNFHRGWLNVDCSRLTDPSGISSQEGRLSRLGQVYYYLEHDLTKPLPIADGSFEWIFSEHFIEHIPLEKAIQWLGNIRRLLRHGGLVRITTPDLRRYAEGYLNRTDDFFAEHHRRLQAQGCKNPPQRPAWMINQIFYEWGHRWIYDFDELRWAAMTAGFPAESIVKSAFHQGLVPEVYALDREHRSDESVYMEIRLAK